MPYIYDPTFAGGVIVGTNGAASQYGFGSNTGHPVTIGAGVVLAIWNATSSIVTTFLDSTFQPVARNFGSHPYFTVLSRADTTLDASTECIGVNWNLSATRQFSTGDFATQREMVIQAPTYSFVGDSTITGAYTLELTGAPFAR